MTQGAASASVGVAVVSYNTAALLDECLASLRTEVAAGESLDVVVVDSLSTDGSVALVRERHPWVRVLPLAENGGYAAAANRALAEWLASSDGPAWLVVMNADTRVMPGALATLRTALAPAGRAVAGPGLVYPNGDFQHAAFHDPGLVQTMLDIFPVARLADSRLNGRYGRRLYDRGAPFSVDFPLGACLMVRTAALRDVGLLDEGYFVYCEEIDWCRRFRAAGYTVWCVPAAQVVHHGGASTSQARSAMFVRLWRSRLRLFARFEGPMRRRALRGAARLGFALRAVADSWAERRGRLSAADHAARRAAVDEIFAGS